jgi:hypothetical protein
MASWRDNSSQPYAIRHRRTAWGQTPASAARAAAQERYFGGEPAGDPDRCMMADHPAVRNGRCRDCGEAVLS